MPVFESLPHSSSSSPSSSLAFFPSSFPLFLRPSLHSPSSSRSSLPPSLRSSLRPSSPSPRLARALCRRHLGRISDGARVRDCRVAHSRRIGDRRNNDNFADFLLHLLHTARQTHERAHGAHCPRVSYMHVQCQKRPTLVSKETYTSVKRDLLWCQKT